MLLIVAFLYIPGSIGIPIQGVWDVTVCKRDPFHPQHPLTHKHMLPSYGALYEKGGREGGRREGGRKGRREGKREKRRLPCQVGRPSIV